MPDERDLHIHFKHSNSLISFLSTPSIQKVMQNSCRVHGLMKNWVTEIHCLKISTVLHSQTLVCGVCVISDALIKCRWVGGRERYATQMKYSFQTFWSWKSLDSWKGVKGVVWVHREGGKRGDGGLLQPNEEMIHWNVELICGCQFLFHSMVFRVWGVCPHHSMDPTSSSACLGPAQLGSPQLFMASFPLNWEPDMQRTIVNAWLQNFRPASHLLSRFPTAPLTRFLASGMMRL